MNRGWRCGEGRTKLIELNGLILRIEAVQEVLGCFAEGAPRLGEDDFTHTHFISPSIHTHTHPYPCLIQGKQRNPIPGGGATNQQHPH